MGLPNLFHCGGMLLRGIGRRHVSLRAMRSVSIIFLACLVAQTAPAQEWDTDIAMLDFENEVDHYKQIGTPNEDDWPICVDDNTVPCVEGVVSITDVPNEVKAGQYALKFSYPYVNAPSPAILDSRNLLRDMISISFWIKSDNEALWVVYILDYDDAGFLATIELLPGEWTYINLTPADFEPDLMADVVKPEMDITRLDIGLAMLDATNKYFTEPGENNVYIDNFLFARQPKEIFEGDYVVDGTTVVEDRPLSIRGDVIVRNGGDLTFASTRLDIEGNVVVENLLPEPRPQTRLLFDGGAWGFLSDYPKQYSVTVKDGSDLTFRDGVFRLRNNLEGDILDSSNLTFDAVRNATRGTTWEIHEGSTLDLLDGDFIGEFILNEGSATTVLDSQLIVFWLQCEGTFPVPITLPVGIYDEELEVDLIAAWDSPPEWDRSLSMINGGDVFWTLNVLPFCEADVVDSTLKAVGVSYWEPFNGMTSVTGLLPEITYDTLEFRTTNSLVTLTNTSVETWNLYTAGIMTLNVTDSLIGEAIAFDDTEIIFNNSELDGSGGHLGSRENGIVRFNGGNVAADIRSYDLSQLFLNDTTVEGNIYASDDAVVTLENTVHTGRVFLFDNAVVIEDPQP